jgi:hypothetical protein
MTGVGNAIVTTANRGTSAALAGDWASTQLQIDAMNEFRAQLGGLLATEVALRDTVAPLLLENHRPWLTLQSAVYSDPELLDLLTELSAEVLP